MTVTVSKADFVNVDDAVSVGDAVNVEDAVNAGDAVNDDEAVNPNDAADVADDVIVDNCDVATVGDTDGSIAPVSTLADGVFRAMFVPSPSCTHQI